MRKAHSGFAQYPSIVCRYMDSVNFRDETKDLSKEITDLLSEENINAMAREIGFVKRDAKKFDGFKFLDMLLFTEFNHKELSLGSMALQLQDRYGITLSKQAVDQRFGDMSVKFFKKVIEKALKIKTGNNPSLDFIGYEKVRIKDSTSFKLPENMKAKYPKGNKANTIAQLRIQFEYDLKNGEILDLSLHPFKEQDVVDAENTLGDISPGELVMRDLGYIKIGVLREIAEKGAFYLNRLNFNTDIYEKKSGGYQKTDLGKTLKEMRRNSRSRIEKEVYIGKGDKFKTRMVIERLPDQEYEKRLVKAKRTESRKGWAHSDAYKAQLGLNVFITNTKIPANKIRLLYTLRWQIELMFKIWKSIGEINEVRKMKIERFETFLFAKLLWIVINWQIVGRLTICFLYERCIALSPYKLYKTLKARTMRFRQAILEGQGSVAGFIEGISSLSPYYHRSERKKGSITWSYDVMLMF